MTEVDSVSELIDLLETAEGPKRGIQYESFNQQKQKGSVLRVTGVLAEKLHSMITNSRELIDELRDMQDNKKEGRKVLYRTTVHLLLDTDSPDAVAEILREHMQKYSAPESCLVDWCYADTGIIDKVTVPGDYEPDEDPFPVP